MKKIFISLLVYIGLSLSVSSPVSAGVLDDIFDINNEANNPYLDICDTSDQDCLERGVQQVTGVSGIVTDQSASDYIQSVIAYLLTFSAVLVTIIIIYAGFLYLTANGDEEKAKKSISIIKYTIGGFIIIFLAAPIAIFLFEALLPAGG